MTEQTPIHRILALKADLERLGCKVTVIGYGQPVITISIVYPADVPPDEGHDEEVKHG